MQAGYVRFKFRSWKEIFLCDLMGVFLEQRCRVQCLNSIIGRITIIHELVTLGTNIYPGTHLPNSPMGHMTNLGILEFLEISFHG